MKRGATEENNDDSKRQKTSSTSFLSKIPGVSTLSSIYRSFTAPDLFTELKNKVTPMLYEENDLPLDLSLFTIENLRVVATYGPDQGKTLLWLSAHAAVTTGQLTIFDAIWQHCETQLTFEDLKARSMAGLDEEISVLQLFISLAAMKEPKYFLAIWRKWQADFTPEDLKSTLLYGENEGKSALWFMTQAAIEIMDFRALISYLLTQWNDIYTPEEIEQASADDKSIVHLFKQCDHWGDDCLNLIYARNAFFKKLATFNPEEDFESIWPLAQNAAQQGYCNAFFDLGNVLLKHNAIQKACSAFANVPPTSNQYHFVNGLLSKIYLEQALHPELSIHDRKHLLEQSLQFSLNLPKKLRKDAIQAIAYTYISENGTLNFISSTTALIPKVWLKRMDSKISIEWCFAIFEESKRKQLLEQRCLLLEMKIQAHSQTEMTVELTESVAPLLYRNRENSVSSSNLTQTYTTSDLDPPLKGILKRPA